MGGCVLPWVGGWVGGWVVGDVKENWSRGSSSCLVANPLHRSQQRLFCSKEDVMGHPKTYLLRLNCCTPPCFPSHFQCHYLGHQQQQVGRGKGESGHVKEDVGEWEFRPGHSCHSRLYREGTTCQQSEGRGAENSTSSYPQPQYKSHLHNCRLGEWGRFLHNICSLATPLPFYFQQAPHMNLEKSNDLLKHDKCFPNGESHWYWLSSSVADP